MGKFDHSDNYTPNAGLSGVVFGSETPILEVELNEMQLIQQKRLGDFLKKFIGGAISDAGAITYSNNKVLVSECDIVANEVLIHCTGLSISATEGSVVYLKVWEDVVDNTSTLKEEGNEQSTKIVPNNIKDSRYDFTTSKRRVYKYTLTTSESQTDSAIYVKLCTITEGELKIEVVDGQLAFKSELADAYDDTAIKNQIKAVEAKIPTVPTKVSAFTNDSRYLTTETDPTVPSWAKQSKKPTYTASEVGALSKDTKIPSKTSDLTNDSGFITAEEVPSGDVVHVGSTAPTDTHLIWIDTSDSSKPKYYENGTWKVMVAVWG